MYVRGVTSVPTATTSTPRRGIAARDRLRTPAAAPSEVAVGPALVCDWCDQLTDVPGMDTTGTAGKIPFSRRMSVTRPKARLARGTPQ